AASPASPAPITTTSVIRTSCSAEYVSGLVLGADAVDQDDIALGVARAQGQDRLVRIGVVPRAGPLAVGELDGDQVAWPAALQRLEVAAVHDEPAAERGQGSVDPFQVLHDRRPHGDPAHVGNGIGGHEILQVFVRVARYRYHDGRCWPRSQLPRRSCPAVLAAGEPGIA